MIDMTHVNKIWGNKPITRKRRVIFINHENMLQPYRFSMRVFVMIAIIMRISISLMGMNLSVTRHVKKNKFEAAMGK